MLEQYPQSSVTVLVDAAYAISAILIYIPIKFI